MLLKPPTKRGRHGSGLSLHTWVGVVAVVLIAVALAMLFR